MAKKKKNFEAEIARKTGILLNMVDVEKAVVAELTHMSTTSVVTIPQGRLDFVCSADVVRKLSVGKKYLLLELNERGVKTK